MRNYVCNQTNKVNNIQKAHGELKVKFDITQIVFPPCFRVLSSSSNISENAEVLCKAISRMYMFLNFTLHLDLMCMYYSSS